MVEIKTPEVSNGSINEINMQGWYVILNDNEEKEIPCQFTFSVSE